jgi:hypothetical protein
VLQHSRNAAGYFVAGQLAHQSGQTVGLLTCEWQCCTACATVVSSLLQLLAATAWQLPVGTVVTVWCRLHLPIASGFILVTAHLYGPLLFGWVDVRIQNPVSPLAPGQPVCKLLYCMYVRCETGTCFFCTCTVCSGWPLQSVFRCVQCSTCAPSCTVHNFTLDSYMAPRKLAACNAYCCQSCRVLSASPLCPAFAWQHTHASGLETSECFCFGHTIKTQSCHSVAKLTGAGRSCKLYAGTAACGSCKVVCSG